MHAVHRRFAARWAVLAAIACAVAAPPLAAQYPRSYPTPPASEQPQPEQPPLRACFLLSELGGSELRRRPAEGCDRQVSPAATFELAAALAALDASVVRATGASNGQTLESALAYSSPEYFRDIDRQMGPVRMGEYLNRFGYGNADTRGGGEYWNGGSLLISPNEQMRFLQRLFGDQLPVSRQSMMSVRESLEPPGYVVSSRGRVIAASGAMTGGVPPMIKTGAVDNGTEAVRWQVGMLTRDNRKYVYVSCVTGPPGLAQNAAAIVASHELRNAGVQ
ncbi:beta-lactamase class D [Lysobacter sp. yr284]|uniref:penicillin-binding transpeptidase domain-containing protein n=1 Tax=Lysobacter TaxID=68 RepID=UPI000898955F|nr:penicillin-binding transpeptidase domain-containing protein [Lysobacter sp. yr284]SDZ02797.1 beta-lactamase class D [Lysobacter sp. yr284]